MRAATCSETVIGRVKQTTVKLDSTASNFYTVTADVFSNARSAELENSSDSSVLEAFPVALPVNFCPGLELAGTSPD